MLLTANNVIPSDLVFELSPVMQMQMFAFVIIVSLVFYGIFDCFGILKLADLLSTFSTDCQYLIILKSLCTYSRRIYYPANTNYTVLLYSGHFIAK